MNEWSKSNGDLFGLATFIVAIEGLLFALLFDIEAENREMREELGKTREEPRMTREAPRNEDRETRQELRNGNRETKDELRNETRENRRAIGDSRDAVDNLRLEVNRFGRRTSASTKSRRNRLGA